MANAHYDPSLAGGADVPRTGTLINVIGAAISVALVIGILVWSYQLIMRDVSGVPVVRAIDGPMRIQPEDPGGRTADHQGLSVNTVAADGTAAAPQDRVVLAPGATFLEAEDVPIGVATSGVVPQMRPTTGETSLAINAALETVVQPQPDLSGESFALVAPENAVLSTQRPVARPAGVRAAQVAPATPVAAPANPGIEVSVASLAAGTRLAQIGAYETVAIARAEWDRKAALFGDYMSGKQRVIEEASSGGRTFYRLRVHGFGDVTEARRFCSALKAQNADCIPVLVK